ncbi:solute carrier organic anion transporter family member 2A1-like [Gigantopelta aegis]|uniref:solute carrier organic anion transporter family member 2A1-like n=1 Tax=Gigantopelta aegis TaxID=1735272 RepID=UPI001B88A7FC|nr:solute carrier organic anion transporter family member 2A1-like [Gigantopelta aegis]
MTSQELKSLTEPNDSNSNSKSENDSNKRVLEVNDDDITSCGVGRCRPKRLAWLANINTFTFVFSLSLMPLTAMEVYIGSQISSIEKQFGLNSTTIGALIGCFELGFLVTVLPFGHFGQRGHIPRILSLTAILGGISGILVSACNFMKPATLPVFDANASASGGFSDAPLCTGRNYSQMGNMSSLDICSDTSRDQSNDQWVAVLLGMIIALLGVARSPSMSLSMAFVDDNVSHSSKTSLYLGIIFTVSVIGPAVAMSVGGAVARIPVDLNTSLLQPEHHKWIGAWWLGFLIFGGVSVCTAVPMFFFPRKLKGRRVKEEIKLQNRSLHHAFIDLMKSLRNLFCNPVFMLLLATSCSFLFIIEGEVIFASKYVEHQFMIPSYKASFILGIEQFVSAVVGNIAGGLITYKLKLTRLGCLKLVFIVLTVSTAIFVIEIFLGCDNPHIVGIPPYSNNNLSSCLCDVTSYYPICGNDGVSYFSPCVAGCKQQTGTTFTNCSLISGGLADAGICETGCSFLYYYMATDLAVILIATMCMTPLGICFMRTVDDCDKSLSLALNSFLNSLLGFLPAPILYGMVVDSACKVWHTTCGVANECALYDIEKLRTRLKCLSTIGQCVGSALVLAAFLVLRRKDGAKSRRTPDVDTADKGLDVDTAEEREKLQEPGESVLKT